MATFPTIDPVTINQAYRPNQRDILPIGVKDRNLDAQPFTAHSLGSSITTINTVAPITIIAEALSTSFSLLKTTSFMVQLYTYGTRTAGGGGETPDMDIRVLLDGSSILWITIYGGGSVRGFNAYNSVAGLIPAGEHKFSVVASISDATGTPSYQTVAYLLWQQFSY